jgi:hypothetical protein
MHGMHRYCRSLNVYILYNCCAVYVYMCTLCAGFYEHVKDDTIFLTLHDAVVYARNRSVSPRQSLTSAGDDAALATAAAKASTVTEEGVGGCQHTWKIGTYAASATPNLPVIACCMCEQYY